MRRPNAFILSILLRKKLVCQRATALQGPVRDEPETASLWFCALLAAPHSDQQFFPEGSSCRGDAEEKLDSLI